MLHSGGSREAYKKYRNLAKLGDYRSKSGCLCAILPKMSKQRLEIALAFEPLVHELSRDVEFYFATDSLI